MNLLLCKYGFLLLPKSFWVKLIMEMKKRMITSWCFQHFRTSFSLYKKKYLLLYQKQRIVFMKDKSNRPLSQLATQLRMQRYWSNFQVCPYTSYSSKALAPKKPLSFFLYFHKLFHIPLTFRVLRSLCIIVKKNPLASKNWFINWFIVSLLSFVQSNFYLLQVYIYIPGISKFIQTNG